MKKATKVQIKSSVIENGLRRSSPPKLYDILGDKNVHNNHHMKFEPLVQVDPSVLTSNRVSAMKNPRVGDYMLSKTASTEGIASKKSLELKKRYLLGCDTANSGGLMKSDSTSVLDSKFRNFHSNISECQKLLNPNLTNVTTSASITNTSATATTKEQTQLPTPLAKSETTIGVPAIISTDKTTSIKLSSKEFDSMKNSNEKENVYGKFVKTKNKLNTTTISINEHDDTNETDLLNQPLQSSSPMEIILDLTAIRDKSDKTPSSAAADTNRDNKPANDVIDVIDLITPSPQSLPISISDSSDKDGEHRKQILPNKDLYRKLDYNDDNDVETHQNVIDLTTAESSPIKDDIVGKHTQTTAAERSKNVIDSMIKRGNIEIRKTKSFDEEAVLQPPRSPIHETYIHVPQIPWKTKSKAATDVESDSLSSSTTSSVDDIPHYILDSTTSPDTLPAGSDRFIPPRLEIRDTSGELMQIDSLMIIDGKYIGDPEDLQYMQKIPTVEKENENNAKVPKVTDGILAGQKEVTAKESKVTFANTNTLVTAADNIVTKPKTVYKYESMRNKRPELRFDTRNENKIDTLKNIPLILPTASVSTSNVAATAAVTKPTSLSINTDHQSLPLEVIDADKTPMASATTMSEYAVSDSETEITGPALTETELSDWNADDAVSENFVDIEFVLNSNKGTIRRNKKSRKKQQQMLAEQQQFSKKFTQSTTATAPLAKDLDFDSIEFMDTGSEDSCLETYSATNKALLKNRGYVQFVDTTTAHNSKALLSYKSDAGYGSSPKDSSEPSPAKPKSLDLHEAVNSEVSGIDYIEQGACILLGTDNGCADETINDLDMKTPMNEEVPPIFSVKQMYPCDNHPSESLHDIEDDSLLMIASQGTTTTEDSDALTIVTSPVDSTTPPKQSETTASTPITDRCAYYSPNLVNAGSSSIAKTITTNNTTPETQSIRNNPPSQSFCDTVSTSSLNRSEIIPTTADDTYSDYVRKLQQKISKISNARDSIDTRKVKRKHSKCDLSCCNNVTTIASSSTTINDTPTTAAEQQQQLTQSSVIDNSSSNKPLSIYINNEIHATVNERIEEITKERTKQKDLIHDLVMDKLQSKKQLNAEKRLNRSRNRNMAIFSPPSNELIGLPATTLMHNKQLTEFSSSNSYTPSVTVQKTPLTKLSLNYFTPKTVSGQIGTKYKDISPTSNYLYLSKSIENCNYSKLIYISAFDLPVKDIKSTTSMSKYEQNQNGFQTPIPPPRRNFIDDNESQTTDRLRTEARARARLKSNQDLGLSPDEKMLLLRKRFHLNSITPKNLNANASDDIKLRERKMMNSKSVNDIAATSSSYVHDTNDGTKKQLNFNDFTSDPNLAELNVNGNEKRRHNKDPERRRSIIKAVSDFFYKKKGEKDVSPPSKEKSPSGSNDGMFGRFRISPKSKTKVSKTLN